MSRKLDFGAAIGENSFYEWQNGTQKQFVNRKFAQDGTTLGSNREIPKIRERGIFFRVFGVVRGEGQVLVERITPVQRCPSAKKCFDRRVKAAQPACMKGLKNILIIGLGLGGLLSFDHQSRAQVYDQPPVGYFNLRLAAGDNLIANQLVSQSDTLTNLFQYQIPEGSTFSKWNPTSNQYLPAATYHAGTGWDINYGLTLGEGGLFHAPTAFTNTFVGHFWSGIDLNDLHNVPLVSIYGTLLLSCYLPIAANFHDVVGRDPQDGESVTTLNAATQLYSTTTFDSSAWDNGVPVLNVGQSAFFNITAVPEPSVVGLFGAGSALMLVVSRAKKR